MKWVQLLGYLLPIVEGVVTNIKGDSSATVEQIQNAEAALASLQAVHGSAVTKAQIDGLRG